MKRSFKFRHIYWISALSILVLILAACAPSGTSTTSPTGAAGGSSSSTDTPAASSAGTSAATEAATTASTSAATTAATAAATTASTSAAATPTGNIPVTGGTPTAAAGTSPAGTAMPAGTPSGPVTINLAANATKGNILVDGKGMTLYTYDKDTAGTSTCTGPCAAIWPPVLTNGAPTGGTGVDSSKLGTISLPDGSTMVTYNNKPLYYYSKDRAAGDTNGDGVGGVWHVVTP